MSIRYAPSATVLWRLLDGGKAGDARILESSRLQDGAKAVVVAYSPPQGASPSRVRSLLFNSHEARAVAESMGGDLLQGREATPSRVTAAMHDASYIHFACHGVFDREAPLEAGLELAPGESSPLKYERTCVARLTLGQIFERAHFRRAPLVVLSACETGIPRVEEVRDEYIGLPAGFLFAGAKSVISTLWPVSDLATWLLMSEMARGLASGVGPSEALRRAQESLKHLSAHQAAEQVAQAAMGEEDPERREEILKESKRIREAGRTEPYPFASPYWWAGFTVNGLG